MEILQPGEDLERFQAWSLQMVKIEMEHGEAPCINCEVNDKISGSAPSYISINTSGQTRITTLINVTT